MSKKRKREEGEGEGQQPSSKKQQINNTSPSPSLQGEKEAREVEVARFTKKLNKLAKPAFIQQLIYRLYGLQQLYNKDIVNKKDILNIPSTEDALIKLMWLKSASPQLEYKSAYNIVAQNQLDTIYISGNADTYIVYRAKYNWIKYKYTKKMGTAPTPSKMNELINQTCIKDFDKTTSKQVFDGFLHYIISCKNDYTYDDLALIMGTWILEERSLIETDNNGMTPLHIAAKCKNADAIQALAIIYQKTSHNSQSPDGYDTEDDQGEQTQLLDDSNSNGSSDSTPEPIGIDILDKQGRTPLHVIIDGIIEEIDDLKSRPIKHVPKQCLTIENMEPYIDFSTLMQWICSNLPIDELDSKGKSALELAKNYGLTLIPMYLEGKTQESTKMDQTIDETNKFILKYNKYIEDDLNIQYIIEDNHFALLLHHVVYYSQEVERPITTGCITRILEDPNLLGNVENFLAALNCKVSYGDGPELTPLEYADSMGYQLVKTIILQHKESLLGELTPDEKTLFSPPNSPHPLPTKEEEEWGQNLITPEEYSLTSPVLKPTNFTPQTTPLGEIPPELFEYSL